ncbi:hypothetical protein [Solidesulfovibrio sp.]
MKMHAFSDRVEQNWSKLEQLFLLHRQEMCIFYGLGGMIIQPRGELAAGRQDLSGVRGSTPISSLREDEKRQGAKKYQQEGRP